MSGHPIARHIAEEFGVPVAEVERYHQMGIGYGVLAQLYSIANDRCGATTSYTVMQLVAMLQNGMDIAAIRQQVLGSASANACNLGRLKQGDLDAADGKSRSGKDAPQPRPSQSAAPIQPPKKPAPPKPAPSKPAQPKKPDQAKPEQPKKPDQAKPEQPEKPGKSDGDKGKDGGKGKK